MTIILYQGDCLEYMRTMPAGSVDAVVTDPPYGIEFNNTVWDRFIPDWISEARRISPLVIFTTAPTTTWDYPRPDWVMCWHRTAAKSRTAQGGFNHWSPILVYGKIKFPVDVFYNNAMITSIENRDIKHPTPKPVKLYKWLISMSVKPGDTVFDPFMGSGTTGVAAVQLGRNFIGCEIDPGYFKIAERRINEATLQPQLFQTESQQARQDEML